jgi:casein kinase II subunit alpha
MLSRFWLSCETHLGSDVFSLHTNFKLILTDFRKLDDPKKKFIIKTAPQSRLENERDLLKHYRDNKHIRQLADETKDPPALVLRHFDDDLLDASNKKTLQSADVKRVAKSVLQALKALHEDGYTHTGMGLRFKSFPLVVLADDCMVDVKPDNILVNYQSAESTTLLFDDVQLADFGDVTRIDPEEHLKIGLPGPLMGAAIFRSPEAMLELRWEQSTDIWSFGATVSNVLENHTKHYYTHVPIAYKFNLGRKWHIFKPDPKTPQSTTTYS